MLVIIVQIAVFLNIPTTNVECVKSRLQIDFCSVNTEDDSSSEKSHNHSLLSFSTRSILRKRISNVKHIAFFSLTRYMLRNCISLSETWCVAKSTSLSRERSEKFSRMKMNRTSLVIDLPVLVLRNVWRSLPEIFKYFSTRKIFNFLNYTIIFQSPFLLSSIVSFLHETFFQWSHIFFEIKRLKMKSKMNFSLENSIEDRHLFICFSNGVSSLVQIYL